MLENVSTVGARALTNGSADENYTLISTKELNRLKREREEYREIALSLGQSVPKMHEISKNIDEILSKGGVPQ